MTSIPTRPILTPLLVLALVTLAGAAAGRNADPPESPQRASSLFVERIDVDVVNVVTFVTDGHGNRVFGLTRDDFEVYEDGQQVEISNFYAETRTDRVARALARGGELATGAAPGPEIRQEQQLHLVVYVDSFNLQPANRRRALEQVQSFLNDRLARGDAVMVVGFDGRLSLQQNFTRNRFDVEDALARMNRVTSNRLVSEARRRQTIGVMAQAARDGVLSDAYRPLRSFVDQERSDLRRSMAALSSMVRSLGGLPGRKAILYVSDGLAQRPGEDLYQLLIDLFGPTSLALSPDPLEEFIDPVLEALQEDETHLFSQVIRQANANQVTFYPFDARGTTGHSSLSASIPNLAAGAAGRVPNDQLLTQSTQEPLIALALATGGSAVLNTFSVLDALDDATEDFDSFYSLGFRPSNGGDGEYHTIEVRAKNPDLKLRHRAGYVDKSELERVADRTIGSLLLGLGKNPMGIEVELGAPERKSANRFHLPILVRIPTRELTILPSGTGAEGRLRIFLAVRDADGTLSATREFEYPVLIPQERLEEALDQEIGFARTLEIRPGSPEIVVGVWDELSGIDSFVLTRVSVGEKKRSRSRSR